MNQEKWLGKELPRVELESTAGGKVRIPEDLKGKWTLLYFYPKDDTPGCTKQACSYRDRMEQLGEQKVQVYGVSLDDIESHRKFIDKFSLNFPLLADTRHQLSEALGVYGDQEWNGQKFKGLSRDTFLVSPDGKVAEVWRKVRPDTTVEETFSALDQHLRA